MASPPKKRESKITLLPQKPGIYIFKNADDEIIYIGKAHSLRDRVKSYFQKTSDTKVTSIISETEDIDFILTGSEKEAAFLENNFIRRYQPKYNLRLKDDKSFPYVKLTVREKFPGIYFTRRVGRDGSRYFGPFSLAHQARKSIHLASRYFGIRGCDEAVPGKRKRPCLEYDLHLCSAPCVGSITEPEYRENVNNALLFLEGKTEKLLNILFSKMTDASSREEFEEAAQWRDLVQTIERMREKPKLISPALDNKDIIGFSRAGGRAAFYVFFMRKGQVLESEETILEVKEETSAEDILSSFLKRFYKNRQELPDTVLLPFPLGESSKLRKALPPLVEKKGKIMVPARGKNKQLVELAQKNAELLLQKKGGKLPPLEDLKNILDLTELPRHIEGFDISNIGGWESVGSLVVFEDGLPKKEEYRKFTIKTVSGPNDVASLQEVIERRYRKVLDKKKNLPDLIMVDGGKGQLSAARLSLQKLGLDSIPVVALAKKKEIIFTPSKREGLVLERTSPSLKLLQTIRDEAHRFAISFHRLRRKKRSFDS